jgi:hypothetical protein
MDLAAKLPTMDDGALATLHANAERLMQTGTSAQQSAAAALMPSIKTELAARTAAKRNMTKAKPPSRNAQRTSSPMQPRPSVDARKDAQHENS